MTHEYVHQQTIICPVELPSRKVMKKFQIKKNKLGPVTKLIHALCVIIQEPEGLIEPKRIYKPSALGGFV